MVVVVLVTVTRMLTVEVMVMVITVAEFRCHCNHQYHQNQEQQIYQVTFVQENLSFLYLTSSLVGFLPLVAAYKPMRTTHC